MYPLNTRLSKIGSMPRERYNGRIQTLYFRSQKEKEVWDKAAKETGEPTSKFILEMAELGRRKKELPNEESRQTSQFRKELREIREKNQLLEMLREKHESEILKLRHRIFLGPDHDGQWKYSKELRDLLQKGGVWPGHEIIRSLHISPEDHEAVQIVINQLRGLESYGLVRETVRGWQWI